MNAADKIKNLQRQIKEQQFDIENCNHTFGVVSYEPEIVMEPIGTRMETSGSDIWFVPDHYAEVKVPRWSKTCKDCGFKLYTKKTKLKSTDTEPDF